MYEKKPPAESDGRDQFLRDRSKVKYISCLHFFHTLTLIQRRREISIIYFINTFTDSLTSGE